MRKTCFEMMREIGFETGLLSDLTITSFSAVPNGATLRAQLLLYLNRAKAKASRKIQSEIMTVVEPIETVAQYRAGTVSIATADTTVTGSGTTFTAFMVGRKIRIGSDMNSYRIIKFTDTTHIEIDKSYPGATQSGKTYTIYQDTYPVSSLIDEIIDLRRPDVQRQMNRRTKAWLNSRYPDPLQASGEPWDWSLWDYLVTREPLTGTYAAATSTTTTSVIFATSKYAGMQDYYKGWYLYNVTRSQGSRIIGYDAATTALILETAITGQVATDTFWLESRQLEVCFRPAPLSTYYYLVTGIKGSASFVNDYDYEFEIDDDYEDVLIFQACADYYLTREPTRNSYFQGLADQIYQELKEFSQAEKSSKFRFTGGGDNVPRIQAYGNTMVVNET